MVAEPIVDTQWGRADWTDYENNWREKDAEYIQARVVMRFHSDTDKATALGASPPVGTVVYNETLDRLEWRSKLGAWGRITPMPLNLTATQDTSAGVALSHVDAAGKGVTFTPADIKITGPLDVLSGVVKVAASGISLKTGATTAVLSTDATGVVGDKPFSIPSLTLTGTGTVLTATGKTIAVGTVTATLVTSTNINMSGTLTGGVLNGSGGTIGGVKLGLAPNTNAAEAPSGFISGVGKLSGDSSKATLAATGKAARIELDDNIGLYGTLMNINLDSAVRNKSIAWYDVSNTLRGYYAVSVYSATDPGATNYPEGAIWFG